MRVAERPRDVAGWQRNLAQALAVAAKPDGAAVSLCTLGSRTGLGAAVAPSESSAVGRRLIESLLPPADSPNLETVWSVSAATTAGRRVLPVEDLGAGLIGAFLRSQEGIVAGWIVLLSRAPLHERMRALAVPFAEVCRAAEVALRGSLAIAAAMGARFPRVSPAGLSAREQEVATLASSGFSDLNISARLGISEGTVGRHLHNIYRKLGIGSRMQLSDLMCGAAFAPPEQSAGGLVMPARSR